MNSSAIARTCRKAVPILTISFLSPLSYHAPASDTALSARRDWSPCPPPPARDGLQLGCRMCGPAIPTPPVVDQRARPDCMTLNTNLMGCGSQVQGHPDAKTDAVSISPLNPDEWRRVKRHFAKRFPHAPPRHVGKPAFRANLRHTRACSLAGDVMDAFLPTGSRPGAWK